MRISEDIWIKFKFVRQNPFILYILSVRILIVLAIIHNILEIMTARCTYYAAVIIQH